MFWTSAPQAGAQELAGRIAVVTGAGSGFGAAMAASFARAGAAVAVLDIVADAAESTAANIASQHGVPTTWAALDVADGDALIEVAADVGESLGGCDILAANVGVQQFGAIDQLTDDDWRFVLDVNVMGTVRTVRAFLPLIRRRGGLRRILLTASSSVLAPAVRLGAYQTTKFAVMGFGETLRHELALEGIGVSVVFPGPMLTSHLDSSQAARPHHLSRTGARPEDLEAMLSHRPVAPEDLVEPDHAVRNVLADLLADVPYIVTHGVDPEDYLERHDAMATALARSDTAPIRDTSDAPKGGPVEQLRDIEAIKQLKARYFRLLDTKRWDDWAQVFSTDVALEVPEADLELRGREAVVGFVRNALEGARTVHQGHTPEIELTGADTARGVWAMFDFVEWPTDDGSRLGLHGYGHYLEHYVREDGEWRIARSRLERLRTDPID